MDVMLIDPQDLTAMLLDDKVELSGRMVRLIAKRGIRPMSVCSTAAS
jgi:hypothetical protein